ncbi:hypothetical protein AAFF_G00436030 [Aldrovandia affinis]|uniref:Uncharacterized protein n=1 Tax=Aldrovandia affinis TaxID=143900 RepID=A0AAD7WIT3_9TELE|nr:hypothetical protein AAFF_G00436030 [Aldrovandia affinis]
MLAFEMCSIPVSGPFTAKMEGDSRAAKPGIPNSIIITIIIIIIIIIIVAVVVMAATPQHTFHGPGQNRVTLPPIDVYFEYEIGEMKQSVLPASLASGGMGLRSCQDREGELIAGQEGVIPLRAWETRARHIDGSYPPLT